MIFAWLMTRASADCSTTDLGGVAVSNLPPAGPFTPPGQLSISMVDWASGSFTTGSCHTLLAQVELVGSGFLTLPIVTIHDDDAGAPGAPLEVLLTTSWDGPWAPRAHASAGLLLTPLTQYHVVVAAGPADGAMEVGLGATGAETGSASWEIGDDHGRSLDAGSSWPVGAEPLWLQVETLPPPDGDLDGVADPDDPCPADNPDDPDGDGECGGCPDADGDTVCDATDACAGDDATGDDDGDGVCDDVDACTGADTTGDRDGDGSCGDVDCDDGEAEVNPAARERCDGVDSNCDGFTPYDEVDLNENGVPDCACVDGRCPEFIDDGGSAGCNQAVGPVSWLGVAFLLGLRRRGPSTGGSAPS